MKIVIIGGGFCGIFVAKKIEKELSTDVTLIDNKSFFEYQPNLHKVITNPVYLEKLRLNYEEILQNSEIVVDNIKTITKNHVITSNQKIPFDILVISTGIDYPIFLENKKNVFVLKNGENALSIAQKINNSSNLLIVGGGLIGTEIAGEISTKLPNKKVTIVHSNDRLLERNPKDASYYARKMLEKKDVNIIFNEKVISQKNGVFFTNKNSQIESSLCIWCTGIKCEPYYMKNFPESCLTDRNSLSVNDYLQLQGFENIFVGGDINNIIEEKTARKAELHAKIIAKNIKRIIEDKNLVKYKKGRSPMFISLGDTRGIFLYKYVFPGLIFPGIAKKLIEWWVLRQLK